MKDKRVYYKIIKKWNKDKKTKKDSALILAGSKVLLNCIKKESKPFRIRKRKEYEYFLIDNLYDLIGDQYEKKSKKLCDASSRDKNAIIITLHNESLPN